MLGKENALAIIANGCMMSQKDYKEAIDFLIQNDVKYIEMSYNPLEIVQFKENRKDRCYYCKKSLMTNI
ncbi:MAG: TIGR00268 family protein, partial [Bacilli bacterium]|nr:TIGR00268 family protein [Bacilli bacterium]